MSILFLLVPAALLLAGIAVWGFSWAVKSGQFDDTQTPAHRILWDEQPSSPQSGKSNNKTDENEGAR